MINWYFRLIRAVLGLIGAVLLVPFLTKCSEDAGAFGAEGDRLPFVTPLFTIIISGVVCLIGGAYFGRMLIGAIREGRADKWLRATLPSDVLDVLSVDMLGSTPLLKDRHHEKIHNEYEMIVTNDYLRAQFVQWKQYRRSNITLVTSANPGEGKSTTAVGLALALSRVHKRVLIVDADLLNGNLAYLLNVDGEGEGWSDWVQKHLSGVEFDIPVLQINPYLYFMRGGSASALPCDMAHIASSIKMWDLIAQPYDVVIVDGPPLITPMALEIASGIQDIILAVSAKTPLARARYILDDLLRDRAIDVRVLLTMRRSGVHPQELWFYHRRDRPPYG